MQTAAGRIREHVQNVQLLLFRNSVVGAECLVFVPVLLPTGFNRFEVITGHGGRFSVFSVRFSDNRNRRTPKSQSLKFRATSKSRRRSDGATVIPGSLLNRIDDATGSIFSRFPEYSILHSATIERCYEIVPRDQPDSRPTMRRISCNQIGDTAQRELL